MKIYKITQKHYLQKKAQKVGKGKGFYSYQTRVGGSNGSWNNEVGYGRVNASAAVEAACSITDYWGNTVTTNTAVTDCIINTSDITVKPNAKLTFHYCNEVYIIGAFEVEKGATLEIKK